MEEIKTEIICAVIAATGAVLSALIAWFVSRSAAAKEIEKLRLTWEREDVVSSDDEYASMAAVVASYIQCDNGHCQREAMAAVASVRIKESGDIGVALDQLYECISNDQIHKTDSALTHVIEKKREAKSQAKAKNDKKPNE